MKKEIDEILSKLSEQDRTIVLSYVLKLERENIGMRQTIANFREKQEKFFKNMR